jgi:hypothetical protein
MFLLFEYLVICFLVMHFELILLNVMHYYFFCEILAMKKTNLIPEQVLHENGI